VASIDWTIVNNDFDEACEGAVVFEVIFQNSFLKTDEISEDFVCRLKVEMSLSTHPIILT
jgi:hypothetical protein